MIKFIRSAYESNLQVAQSRCRRLGVNCSVMVKDAIISSDYLAIVRKSNFSRIWARGIHDDNAANYMIGDGYNAVSDQVPIIINSVNQLRRLIRLTKQVSYTPSVFIAVDAFEVREGISYPDAQVLAEAVQTSQVVRLLGFTANGGCHSNYRPNYGDLKELCRFAKNFGKDIEISLGGSMFLAYDRLPQEITEIRIGEYLLLGNVPLAYDSEMHQMGVSAFEATATVLYIEKRGGQYLVLINAGYNAINKRCRFQKDGIQLGDSSSEYSTLVMTLEAGTNVIEGEVLTYYPDYETLTRLL